jgi:dynein heavy chain
MFCVGLRNMLDRYHRIMNSLKDAEVDLLSVHIKQLQQTLKSGFTRLNWNTLGIKEYVTKCEKMIDKFESLVNQLHDIARDISGRIELIAMSDYFVYTESGTPDIKTYFEVVEANRARDIELLARKYRAMGPLLTKLEGLVVSTNTGRAERMANYYKYWEKQVYEAVVRAIVDNLTNFSNALKRKEPIFRIEAALTGSDIVLRPGLNDIQKLVLQTLRDIVEGMGRHRLDKIDNFTVKI